MTFEQNIKFIEEKLKETYLSEFKEAYNLSMEDNLIAFHLGLFFRYLKEKDLGTYDKLKPELNYLRDYYERSEWNEYFFLRKKIPAPKKFTVIRVVLLLFGITFILLGILRIFNGDLTIFRGYKGTTYMTGYLGILYGLITLYIPLVHLRIAFKRARFYKKISG